MMPSMNAWAITFLASLVFHFASLRFFFVAPGLLLALASLALLAQALLGGAMVRVPMTSDNFGHARQ